jgi:hypothetical protein
MKLKLRLELSDVYGGDGFTRFEQVEELRLSRSRRKVQVRTDVGVPITAELAERRTEIVDREVQTFKRGPDGEYYLRLGGAHGKLWGALKESAEILKDIDGTFKSYSEITRLMRSVRVLPVWARLEDPDGIRLEKEPQILSGSKSSMINIYFDVISRAVCHVELTFPDPIEPKVRKMLKQLESINCLNRRRATIRILGEDLP